MGFIPNYLKPPNSELILYAKHLYANISKAKYVKRISISERDWAPKIREYHNNVIEYCELHPESIPIHGWLYFDLLPLGYVRFMAHSVVKFPDGKLYDITPLGTENEYLFIESFIEDDSFSNVLDALKKAYGISYLDHQP